MLLYNKQSYKKKLQKAQRTSDQIKCSSKIVSNFLNKCCTLYRVFYLHKF